MKGLLLVDIQNDFCPGGALAVKEGDKIIPIVNRLKQNKWFGLIVLSRDWHPKNHWSFAVNHPGKKIGDRVNVDGIPQILWPVHCVQNSFGAAFHKNLIVDPADQIISKGTEPRLDGYSTFYDLGHRQSTGLTELLKEKGVDEIYICGLATDYCVKFSVLDALAEGFKVNVIMDACRGIDLNPGDVAQAIQEMKLNGARILPSSELTLGV